jgi:hypothetical protein
MRNIFVAGAIMYGVPLALLAGSVFALQLAMTTPVKAEGSVAEEAARGAAIMLMTPEFCPGVEFVDAEAEANVREFAEIAAAAVGVKRFKQIASIAAIQMMLVTEAGWCDTALQLPSGKAYYVRRD